ncbi:type II secretion system protein GspC [Vibrio methylphosphonaticus]|uniref:type II secretion system protein GspC n=1 Tax=Vibrio methylphosphonaticus TaxID=2946866 RepID=UPI002029F818|nr:type II secretion system protein GspC [Vibrio methylphosphonaticus]MCL9776460.1 type II secretion system protein GspC [Vibrio methylphosphonaticus]
MQSAPLFSYLRRCVHYQPQLSLFIALCLLGLSAWIAGVLAWQLFPQTSSVGRWLPPTMVNVQSTGTSNTAYSSEINKANIFGQYQRDQKVVQAPVVTDAPKTRLNVVLVGSVVSNNPNRSLAVVANRGKQGTYGIGEQIEGTRATIAAVLIDRIIISNSGRDETVMLEGIEYKKLELNQPAPAAASNVVGNNPRDNEEKLAAIRSTITQDPQQIFQYVRLSQVKRDGKISGYRVSPGRDAELFNAVGLQNGDIAVALNGADLTDPAAMGQIYQSISDLTELNLTVERDGQQHDIFIQF